MKKTTDDLAFGDVVAFLWSTSEVLGTVAEVYGPPNRRMVVLALDPELTGYVVAEPTTLALPIDEVRLAAAASRP